MKCGCGGGRDGLTLCELHAIEFRHRLRALIDPLLRAGDKLEIALQGIAVTPAEKAVAMQAIHEWLGEAFKVKEKIEG